MKNIYTNEEIDLMNKEVQSYRKARKFEFILLDPTGVEIDRHVFHYTGGWANRIFLKIDDWEYYAGIDGKYINRIGPDPEESKAEKPTFIDKARVWLELRRQAMRKKDSEEKIK